MKKSQRLRLAALLSKGDAATANEHLEMVWLNALAAANPDAAKDEDDSPTGFRVALMESLSGRKTLGTELATAKARIIALEAELATAPAAAAAKLTTDLAEANSRIAIFRGALGMKATDIAATATGEQVRAAIDQRLGALAGEKIAELGFPAERIPPSAASSGAPAPKELPLAEFRKLTPEAKMAFVKDGGKLLE